MTNQAANHPADASDADIARTALRDIARDPAAPAAARASAARTLAEISGAIGRHSEKPRDNKDITEMDEGELERAAEG